MGWRVRARFKREGTYVYLWLLHIVVWQKPTQYCKAIILQLKIDVKKTVEENESYVLKLQTVYRVTVSSYICRTFKLLLLFLFFWRGRGGACIQQLLFSVSPVSIKQD